MENFLTISEKQRKENALLVKLIADKTEIGIEELTLAGIDLILSLFEESLNNMSPENVNIVKQACEIKITALYEVLENNFKDISLDLLCILKVAQQIITTFIAMEDKLE